MFKQILVAIDMSEMSEAVFKQALSLAKNEQTKLMLLHVLSAEEESSPLPIPSNLGDIYPAAGNDLTIETWRKQWEEFQHQGLEKLQLYAERASNIGVNVEYQQITGSPSRTICKVAKNFHADLIVIGHRGRSGLGEMVLGSVSNYVLHHASCSVLLVQISPECAMR